MRISLAVSVVALAYFTVACDGDRQEVPTAQLVPVASSVYTERSDSDVQALNPVKPSSSGARAANATTTQQQQVLQYINEARSKPCQCGSTTYPAVPPLALNTQLNVASDKHAVDMATNNYFSHTGRDGSKPWDRMTREGYVWRAAGENIAAGYTTTRAVVDGWLKSPGHCANIMSPNFKEVGVGYGYSSASTYKHYWVTDFGTKQ